MRQGSVGAGVSSDVAGHPLHVWLSKYFSGEYPERGCRALKVVWKIHRAGDTPYMAWDSLSREDPTAQTKPDGSYRHSRVFDGIFSSARSKSLSREREKVASWGVSH